MGKHWSSNPRLSNRKAYADLRSAVHRRAALGEPCAICGKPIDLDAPQWVVRADGRRVRAPWSLEVDHVVPLARGGDAFDPANVQPAHRACNRRKGAGARGHDSAQAAHGSTSRDW